MNGDHWTSVKTLHSFHWSLLSFCNASLRYTGPHITPYWQISPSLCPFQERMRLKDIYETACCTDAAAKMPRRSLRRPREISQKELQCHVRLNPRQRLLLVIKSRKAPCKYKLTGPQMRIIFTFTMTHGQLSSLVLTWEPSCRWIVFRLGFFGGTS